MKGEWDSVVIYLLRKTNLTHKEITEEFRADQVVEFYNECRYQESIDDWKASQNAAMVTATIANVNRKRGARAFKPSDFVGEPPRREDDGGELDDLAALAESMGIKTPTK